MSRKLLHPIISLMLAAGMMACIGMAVMGDTNDGRSIDTAYEYTKDGTYAKPEGSSDSVYVSFTPEETGLYEISGRASLASCKSEKDSIWEPKCMVYSDEDGKVSNFSVLVSMSTDTNYVFRLENSEDEDIALAIDKTDKGSDVYEHSSRKTAYEWDGTETDLDYRDVLNLDDGEYYNLYLKLSIPANGAYKIGLDNSDNTYDDNSMLAYVTTYADDIIDEDNLLEKCVFGITKAHMDITSYGYVYTHDHPAAAYIMVRPENPGKVKLTCTRHTHTLGKKIVYSSEFEDGASVGGRCCTVCGFQDLQYMRSPFVTNVKYSGDPSMPAINGWSRLTADDYTLTPDASYTDVGKYSYTARFQGKYSGIGDYEFTYSINDGETTPVKPDDSLDEEVKFADGISDNNLVSDIESLQEGESGTITFNDENSTLSEEVFDAIKGRDVSLVCADESGDFQWTFNGKDITEETKDVDLSIGLSKQAGAFIGLDDDYVKIDFAENGTLPGKAEVRFTDNYLRRLQDDGEDVKLFYIENEGTSEERYVEMDTAVKFDQSGDDVYCTFDITHNSSYITAKVPFNIKYTRTHRYTGKYIKPTVTVFTSQKTLQKGKDYTVSYKNNKNVGTGTLTVTSGKFSRKGDFKIIPKKTSIKSIKAGKKTLKVTWKKQTKQVSGYHIQYSLKSSMSGASTITVSSAKKTSRTIKKLESGKKYYVRVETYKGNYTSGWSSIKSVKVK